MAMQAIVAEAVEVLLHLIWRADWASYFDSIARLCQVLQ